MRLLKAEVTVGNPRKPRELRWTTGALLWTGMARVRVTPFRTIPKDLMPPKNPKCLNSKPSKVYERATDLVESKPCIQQ